MIHTIQEVVWTPEMGSATGSIDGLFILSTAIQSLTPVIAILYLLYLGKGYHRVVGSVALFTILGVAAIVFDASGTAADVLAVDQDYYSSADVRYQIATAMYTHMMDSGLVLLVIAFIIAAFALIAKIVRRRDSNT